MRDLDGEGSVERGYRVTGRVQGVGFRWWTRRVAVELGLEGAVRNRSDGSVEVRARGSATAIERLEDRLWEGPAGARVESVVPVDSLLSLPEGDFIIRGWNEK